MTNLLRVCVIQKHAHKDKTDYFKTVINLQQQTNE